MSANLAGKPAIQEAVELLERAHDAFHWMPALHGAYAGVTVPELRDEVNAALDSYWDDLSAFLGRDAK